jgi:hypothetical protein
MMAAEQIIVRINCSDLISIITYSMNIDSTVGELKTAFSRVNKILL